ncbi:MAG: hypothetical protein KOO62_12400 [candidate division Zixibacteria bacterium]|nr:hypothetical protein [candidate division Zixibacteria bacterium]
MRVDYADPEWERLATDASYLGKWHPAVIQKYREVILYLQIMRDRRSLYDWKGLQCEKLKGEKNRHSVRLDRRWRVYFAVKKIEKAECVVILKIGKH